MLKPRELLLQKVSLSEIDFSSSQAFNFSFPLRTEASLKLLKDGGVLYPPLLYPLEKGYLVVDGLARILALKSLEIESFYALILKETLSLKELLLISLDLNLMRGLNLVEKSNFMLKAREHFSKEEQLKLLPRLGFSKHQNWLFYLEKISLLEEPFKLLLSQERLNPKLIEPLSCLSPEERKAFLQILDKLSLTHSEQREVLQGLLDLKRRASGERFLPLELSSLLEIEDFNLRKQRFFETLNRLKFPHFYAKKEALEKIKKHFGALGLEINFSPYLEKREITLTFKVKTLEDLKKALNFLERDGQELFSVFA